MGKGANCVRGRTGNAFDGSGSRSCIVLWRVGAGLRCARRIYIFPLVRFLALMRQAIKGCAGDSKRILVAAIAIEKTQAGTETLPGFSLYDLDGDAFACLEIGCKTNFAMNTATKLVLDQVLIDHASSADVGLDVEPMSLEDMRSTLRASRSILIW